MSMPLRVRPEAEADLDHAFSWYEERRAGLGLEFLDEVEACLETVSERPRLYAEVHRTVRRALTRRFPYAVFYVIVDDEITMLAVLHQAVSSRRLRQRLR